MYKGSNSLRTDIYKRTQKFNDLLICFYNYHEHCHLPYLSSFLPHPPKTKNKVCEDVTNLIKITYTMKVIKIFVEEGWKSRTDKVGSVDPKES